MAVANTCHIRIRPTEDDDPDPRTSVPADFGLGKYQGLSDFDGAILVWPSTIDFYAPAYTQAAAACGPPAQKIGLGHPHC